MVDFSIEAPHLTASVYAEGLEDSTFDQVNRTVQLFECASMDLVETIPVGREFELLSDLGSSRETVSTSPAAKIPGRRSVRSVFAHPRFGKVITEYLQTKGSGRHPVGITISAGALGIPESMWSAGDRKKAYATADWVRSVFESVLVNVDELYGAIGVELTLPTPWQLVHGRKRISTEVFVSNRLIVQNQAIEDRLTDAFSGGDVSNMEGGVSFSGWAPFNSRRNSIRDPAAASEITVQALRSAFAVRLDE